MMLSKSASSKMMVFPIERNPKFVKLWKLISCLNYMESQNLRELTTAIFNTLGQIKVIKGSHAFKRKESTKNIKAHSAFSPMITTGVWPSIQLSSTMKINCTSAMKTLGFTTKRMSAPGICSCPETKAILSKHSTETKFQDTSFRIVLTINMTWWPMRNSLGLGASTLTR